MENFQGIIARLSSCLAEIDENIKIPLSKSANAYRQATEAICKAIIVGHGVSAEGALEKLIADSVRFVEQDETSRDAGIFKAEIRYLQTIGNTYSHDNADGIISQNESQISAFDSLVKAIRIAFFGEGDLDAPILPKSIEERIPARARGRTKFENPRAEEVIRLCHPKQKIETLASCSDHANRMVYDYVVADLGGLKKGFLFLRTRTAIKNSLADFKTRIDRNVPDALEIITPRVQRHDGKEVDRKKSISEIIKDIGFDSKFRRLTVIYFDDFVWNYCLPSEVTSRRPPIKKAENFIEQTLQPIDDTGSPFGQKSSSSQHVKKILSNSHEYHPVNIIIGPAGMGKTTFADDISAVINDQDRKRVVLFSATDFREISVDFSIDSVGDLYRLAVENGLLEDDSRIESHNFEINLACGNFVLIIDGFDEIESHLGAALHFENFMRSLADIEECFRKVLVILTVRDYDVDRFKNFGNTSICRLQGFTEADTDRYLAGRLPARRIAEAKDLLGAFDNPGETKRATTIPLYASLICDYLVEQDAGKRHSPSTLGSANFFSSGKPLDSLVRKIVDLEITKQSLGKINPDEFFDILIEVIRAPQHTMKKSALLELVSACDGCSENVNPVNFLRNPFLRWNRDEISFKYDSLTYFFKSRFLAKKIKEGVFSPLPAIEFLSEFYRGEGPLFDEFKSIFPSEKFDLREETLIWFKGLVEFRKQDNAARLPWRKAISAFLYWALGSTTDKFERSKYLERYFGGRDLHGLSIYDRFFPLDLRALQIHDGLLEDYVSLPNCETSAGEVVFHKSHISFDDRFLPDKIDRTLFSDDCSFSQNLVASFHAKTLSDENSYEVIVDNLYKILKIGFRANRFSRKSKDVYKKATVVGRHSLDAYLRFLTSQGVLNLELSRAGSEPGYVVANDWYLDARKLVEGRNITSNMDRVIMDLPNEIQ
ncbi:NACHT domain-containing protein [Achromobacter sp. ACM04]|uniref:NACHT domain-containing protein n=1 Tax=Achromobacter sp. ACM04 TaxID=2769312 RepID=UPI00177B8FEE|nr:ATP-binding protein [Achromobacter sp. ACM04]MBD9419120.1 NACHT domain-containing protein [Achromobacter sp. ACM04]